MRNKLSSVLTLLAIAIFFAGCYDTVISPGLNSIPEALITSPTEGQSYVEGDSVHFAGSGMDEDDGELAGGARSVRHSRRGG